MLFLLLEIQQIVYNQKFSMGNIEIAPKEKALRRASKGLKRAYAENITKRNQGKRVKMESFGKERKDNE